MYIAAPIATAPQTGACVLYAPLPDVEVDLTLASAEEAFEATEVAAALIALDALLAAPLA